MTLPIYHRYWGKTRKAGENGNVPPPIPAFHHLAYHCLDVAACGIQILDANPFLLTKLSRELSIPSVAFRQIVAYFLSVHDIGKFSPIFQQKQPTLASYLGQSAYFFPRTYRHDTAGFVFWRERVCDANACHAFRYFDDEGLLSLARCFFGHHGVPPEELISSLGFENIPLHHVFHPASIEAAMEYEAAARDLFLGSMTDAPESAIPLKIVQNVSWWLAGFAVTADWLGSDSTLFGFSSEDVLLNAGTTLADYWNHFALPKAEIAVRSNGVAPAAVKRKVDHKKLFPHISDYSELQRRCSEVSLPDGPMLAIVEDLTGSGKSEAALILAQRLMERESANGIFIALPSMATANAMYERMAGCYRRLYEEDSRPSLILTHGKSLSVPLFTSTIYNPRAETVIEPEDGAAVCNQWLADNRKRALLSDIGIGTIDQALLSVLPARHQSLRLHGLGTKVLIVDEVHSYDFYVRTLLKSLLQFHSAIGGSCILLSATLPLDFRDELIKAFSRDCRVLRSEPAYPALTIVGSRGDSSVCHVTSSARKEFHCHYIHEERLVVERILAVVNDGGCVCWIRNTVRDAQDTFSDFLEKVGIDQSKVLLFHSRFCLGDRLDRENQIQTSFGKNSTEMLRSGAILIATQVVEQSLDLDFDLVVSDLAPIDCLIQRAGRLHRHVRASRPLEAIKPTMLVFGPEYEADPTEEWYSGTFPKAAKVYRHAGQVWKTAKLLQNVGRIELPEMARTLLEFVYSDQEDVPLGLETPSARAVGESFAERSSAKHRMLRVDEGYQLIGSSWGDETILATRLGDGSECILAKEEGDRLIPYYANSWDLSRLRLPHNPDPVLCVESDLTCALRPFIGEASVVLAETMSVKTESSVLRIYDSTVGWSG